MVTISRPVVGGLLVSVTLLGIGEDTAPSFRRCPAGHVHTASIAHGSPLGLPCGPLDSDQTIPVFSPSLGLSSGSSTSNQLTMTMSMSDQVLGDERVGHVPTRLSPTMDTQRRMPSPFTFVVRPWHRRT